MRPGLFAPSPQRSQTATDASSATPTFLQADEFAAPRFLSRWYRWFAPSPPQENRLVTLKEREALRRGRLASIILAVQLLFIELPVIPVVLHAPNGTIVLPWLAGCIAVLLAAFYCNRRGWLVMAGALMVVSIEVTVIIKIVTIPGGISVFYLPQFDILIQPILIAVALLAPTSAFLVAGFNILFVLFALIAGPHAPDLEAALHNPVQAGDLFAVPIMAQILTAFFAWIIVKNLLEALTQADKAENIAALQLKLAEHHAQTAERNQQLERGSAAIFQTLRLVARGDTQARILLPPENAYWSIAQQVNLFLDRYGDARTTIKRLEATEAAIQWFANEIYTAHREHRPLTLPPRMSGTALDPVLMALRDSGQFNP
jgi:hypothetical protein